MGFRTLEKQDVIFPNLGKWRFMKYAQVAENVKTLVECPPVKDEFIYELLLKNSAFFKLVGRDRRARRDGQLGDLSLPKDLFAAMEELKAEKKIKSNDPRFLIVGNGLQERENHSGDTMLYDPDKMPDREAHHNHTVDRLYRSKPFTSDEERLEHLFKLYEEMTAKEQLV